MTGTDPSSPLYDDGGRADDEDVLYCQIMDNLDSVDEIDASELGDIVIDLWPDTNAINTKISDYIKTAVNAHCVADIKKTINEGR